MGGKIYEYVSSEYVCLDAKYTQTIRAALCVQITALLANICVQITADVNAATHIP